MDGGEEEVWLSVLCCQLKSFYLLLELLYLLLELLNHLLLLHYEADQFFFGQLAEGFQVEFWRQRGIAHVVNLLEILPLSSP